MSDVITRNINVQEQAAYTRQLTIPRDMQGAVATGETEEWRYTGLMPQLQELFDAKKADGSLSTQVSLTLTRAAGNFGELVVRHSYYTAPDPEATDHKAKEVGSSRNNPSYDYTISTATESIMLHPLIAEGGLSDDLLTVLAHLTKGGTAQDVLRLSDGYEHFAGEYILHYAGDQGAKLLSIVATPQWLDIRINLSVTYAVAPDALVALPTACQIHSQVPGPLPTPAGRNWLSGPAKNSVQGDKCTVTEEYILSGPGGWDPDIYQSAS